MSQIRQRSLRYLLLLLIGSISALPASAAPNQPFPETRKLLGHRDGVLCVTFTPDSLSVVSGGYDKTIRVWDVATGNCVRKIDGHTGAVRSVAVSRDGKWIASGSDDCTVRVWALDTGAQIAQFEGHTQQVRTVKFLPDGTVASAGGDGVRLWDVKTEKRLWKMREQLYVRSMTVSDDGTYLAYSTAFGSTSVWDLRTRELTTLAGYAIYVPNAVGLSPDGKTLFAEGLSGTVQNRTQQFDRLDLNTGERSPMPGNMAYPQCFAISADGARAVTACKDFDLWDTHTWKKIASFNGSALSGEPLHGLDISRDGKLIVACGGGFLGEDERWTAGEKNIIALFQVSDAEPKTGPVVGNISWEPISTVVKTRDGGSVDFQDYAIYGDYDPVNGTATVGKSADLIFSRRAVLMHREKGVLTELFAGPDRNISHAAWDGQNVWIADIHECAIIVVDSLTGNEIGRFGSQEGLPSNIKTLRLHPICEDKILAAATTNGAVGWCGVLTRVTSGNSAPQSHVATIKLPQKWTGPFQPERFIEPPYSNKSARGILIVCSGAPVSQSMLWIDAATLTARPFNCVAEVASLPNLEADSGPITATYRRSLTPVRQPGQFKNVVYWLDNISFIDLTAGLVRRGRISRTDVDNSQFEQLCYLGGIGLNARIFDQDGSLYLVGGRWMRIDPLMNRFQDLGKGFRVEGESNAQSALYFKSALTGISALTKKGGGLFRLSADASHPLAVRATANVVTGQVIPANGIYDANRISASFYCGEGAIQIDYKTVKDVLISPRWRLPIAERDALIAAIDQNSQNAATFGILISSTQRAALTLQYMRSRMTPDSTKFRPLYQEFWQAQQEPQKQQAARKILDEVRSYGQLRAANQMACLTAMRQAVSPELWTQLQPPP